MKVEGIAVIEQVTQKDIGSMNDKGQLEGYAVLLKGNGKGDYATENTLAKALLAKSDKEAISEVFWYKGGDKFYAVYLPTEAPEIVKDEFSTEDDEEVTKMGEDDDEETITESNPLVDDLVSTSIAAETSVTSQWEKTGRIIAENAEAFSNMADSKERQKAFVKIMDDGVDDDLIPEQGKNRKGEMIVLRKRGGKIKWSSWNSTARIVQNTTDIWKGIEAFGLDALFDGDDIISRYELLKMLEEDKAEGPGEAPEDTIKRCIDMVMKKMIDVELKHKDTIDQLLIDLNIKVDDWKNGKIVEE